MYIHTGYDSARHINRRECIKHNRTILQMHLSCSWIKSSPTSQTVLQLLVLRQIFQLNLILDAIDVIASFLLHNILLYYYYN